MQSTCFSVSAFFFRMRGVEEERRRRGKDEGGKGIRVISNVKFKN